MRNSRPYRTVANKKILREFAGEHCRLIFEWFDKSGSFIHNPWPRSSRELLWHCFSLLAVDDKKCRRMAKTLIAETPFDSNHFTPVAAAELLLRFSNQVGPKSTEHLRALVREHLPNLIDVRFGVPSTSNFSCMTTFFLLAAGRVLDGYECKARFSSIPAVYTANRLRAMGMNALRALAHHSEHEPVFAEYNSPNYTPVSLHYLSAIVELIDDAAVRELALEIEMKLWREVLNMYHPELDIPCGPYSRAYRHDIISHNSNMQIRMCCLGLSKERSVPQLLGKARLYLTADGDAPSIWAEHAWLNAGDGHVPSDALAGFKNRKFPHRFRAPFRWDSIGAIDAKSGRYVSVQGDLVPEGEGEMVQLQQRDYALGYNSRQSYYGQSFPFHLHYRTGRRTKDGTDVRSVTGAVVLHGAPLEWVPDHRGGTIEAANFNHAGVSHVRKAGRTLIFDETGVPAFSPIPADELSVNTFIPVHCGQVDEITLNDEVFHGEPIALRSRKGLCRVTDSGFVYTIEYRFPTAVEIQVFRWANFIRFSGFWYRGKKKRLDGQFLGSCRVTGKFSLLKTRGSA